MDQINETEPSRKWLTPTAKAWLFAVGSLASIDGAIWLVMPGFAQSTAYNLAIDMAPQPAWGWGMTIAGTLAFIAIKFDGRDWAADAARAALALYMFITFVVGLSIAALTLTEFKSALTGATKWWGVSIVCLLGIVGPALTDTNKVSVISWVRGMHVGTD